MQLGVVGYARGVDKALRRALATADEVLARARRTAVADGGGPVVGALDEVTAAVHDARAALRAGDPTSEVTYRFQRRVQAAGRSVVAADLAALQADLEAIAELGGVELDRELSVPVVDDVALEKLAGRQWSPLGAVESVAALVPCGRRRRRRRGAAGDAAGDHLGHRGHGHRHAPARPGLAQRLPPRGPRPRPRARGPGDDADAAAALGAGDDAGDAAGEPAGAARALARAAAHVLRHHVELPVGLRGRRLPRRAGAVPVLRRAPGDRVRRASSSGTSCRSSS